MNYYNDSTQQIVTEEALKLQGIVITDYVLKQLNLIPIEYISSKPYNVLTHEIIASEPVLEVDKSKYLVNFEIVELPEERLLSNLNQKVIEKLEECRAKADETTSPYLKDFSETEKLTFEQQRKEALEYIADNNAQTPTLDALATIRGISRLEQVQKAVTKVQNFTALSQYIVGKQQGYEDKIKHISSDTNKNLIQKIEELQGLEFNYELPEN